MPIPYSPTPFPSTDSRFCVSPNYADEFNVRWLPTLKAMWRPKGQQVMIPTPGQPNTHYGIGAVNYHSGETVVIVRRNKRRCEIAEFLQTLVNKHPGQTIYVAWDNASMHKMARSRRSFAAPRVVWCCCTCRPTARG
jgi:hypothetical protein